MKYIKMVYKKYDNIIDMNDVREFNVYGKGDKLVVEEYNGTTTTYEGFDILMFMKELGE